MVPVLERLVAEFPKKTYWMQLSAVYAELGKHEKALALLELAYEQGLLTQGNELMNLAQLYLYNQIPYRAAEVLEEGMKSGAIQPDARAWQLLADSWLHARERQRALPPLQRAAEESESGDAYVRLAQIYLERESWEEARRALDGALEKGRLTSPGHAYLMLGIADASEKRWDDAARAFTEAQEYEPTQKIAQSWLRHLANQRGLEKDAGHGSQVATGAARPAERAASPHT